MRTQPWHRHHIPTINATPDITGLRRTAIAHEDGTLYLERYHLVDTDHTSIRIHHWHASDDQRAPHDHPWPNSTLVISGQLIEHDKHGTLTLGPGTIVTREATDPHRIELLSDDAWTLFTTGPIIRRWGFHTTTGWIHWKDWPHAGHYLDTPTQPVASRNW